MPIYILHGDILHPGTVKVEANSIEDAIGRAENGEFTIQDEQGDCLGFKFDGPVLDEHGVEIEVPDNL